MNSIVSDRVSSTCSSSSKGRVGPSALDTEIGRESYYSMNDCCSYKVFETIL